MNPDPPRIHIAPAGFRRRTVATVMAVVSLTVLATAGEGPAGASQPAARDRVGITTDGRSGAAEPSTGLRNEVVRVSWSGFTPTQQNGIFAVGVMQCRANPQSFDDCYTIDAFPSILNGNRVQGRTAADGTGSTQIEIRPTANLPFLACSAANPCSILVYEIDGLSVPPDRLPGRNVVIPITFARSQADCPPVFDFDVRVDGSATSAELFYAWAAAVCTGADGIVLDYTETSSTTGRENFLDGLVDMGISAIAADDEELSKHPGYRPFSYAPVAASAMVIAYNLRDPFTGNRLDDVVLSPRLIARLITNTNTDGFFKDPELAVLNPGMRFPAGGATRPILRAERTAGTEIVTALLATDPGAQRFLAGNDDYRVTVQSAYRNYAYPTDIFANESADVAYLPRQGQRAGALRLFYGVSPTGSNPETTTFNGVIGVIDLPTARRFGLQVARIKMADGSVVGPTDEAILAGIADMDLTPQGTLVADPTPEAAGAYPLARVDYALVPRQVPTLAKRADIRRVLEYAVGAGQNSLPAGYVPLPAALRTTTRNVAAAITSVEQSAATSTTSTTSTTTTSTMTTVPETTTTTAPPAPPPVTAPFVPAPVTRPVVVATTVEEPETTDVATTTTVARTTTVPPTTEAPPPSITLPAPQLALPADASARPERVFAGLAGLSLAVFLGTVRFQRLRPRGPRKER
jgi:ABC-type phosphate transport system substrate-binding protein